MLRLSALGLAALTLVAAPLPASAEDGAAVPHKTSSFDNGCRDSAVVPADGKQPKGAFRRLDKLPPANHQLTVQRSVDGCETPVIISYGIGGNPDYAMPRAAPRH